MARGLAVLFRQHTVCANADLSFAQSVAYCAGQNGVGGWNSRSDRWPANVAAVFGDHVLDGLCAVLGSSGLSPIAMVVEVSRRSSFGSGDGLDGRIADASV